MCVNVPDLGCEIGLQEAHVSEKARNANHRRPYHRLLMLDYLSSSVTEVHPLQAQECRLGGLVPPRITWQHLPMGEPP